MINLADVIKPLCGAYNCASFFVGQYHQLRGDVARGATVAYWRDVAHRTSHQRYSLTVDMQLHYYGQIVPATGTQLPKPLSAK